jgi:hypothetical protein
VIVAVGATVAGSGSSTGSISGAGSVGPGNSPGTIVFASLDPSIIEEGKSRFNRIRPVTDGFGKEKIEVSVISCLN